LFHQSSALSLPRNASSKAPGMWPTKPKFSSSALSKVSKSSNWKSA
jgi:hypothetical protein